MTSEGLGEMFEGDSADTCAGKFPLVSMGVQAECPACADTGARTPIGASGNSSYFGPSVAVQTVSKQPYATIFGIMSLVILSFCYLTTVAKMA